MFSKKVMKSTIAKDIVSKEFLYRKYHQILVARGSRSAACEWSREEKGHTLENMIVHSRERCRWKLWWRQKIAFGPWSKPYQPRRRREKSKRAFETRRMWSRTYRKKRLAMPRGQRPQKVKHSTPQSHLPKTLELPNQNF